MKDALEYAQSLGMQIDFLSGGAELFHRETPPAHSVFTEEYFKEMSANIPGRFGAVKGIGNPYCIFPFMDEPFHADTMSFDLREPARKAFEESYGYLAGPYVRDKDAIIGSMLICEMAAYYRSIGSSIKERLEAIYRKFGRYLNRIDSFEFPGLSGMDKMTGIMDALRSNPPKAIGDYAVTKITDYTKPQETGLPAANVLIYALEGGASVVVRPSGTEPKIKAYYTTLGADLAEAEAQKNHLSQALKPIFS